MKVSIGDAQSVFYASPKEFRIDFLKEKNTLQATKIKDEPGACEGKIFATDSPVQTGASFYCESSGSLEDTFFKGPIDVIAWLLPLLQ